MKKGKNSTFYVLVDHNNREEKKICFSSCVKICHVVYKENEEKNMKTWN